MNVDLTHLAEKLFPNGQVAQQGEEINGLEKNTMPSNCIIHLRQNRPNRTGERYEFFLVEVGMFYCYLRICDADKRSDYAEFAVIHALAFTDNKNFFQQYRDDFRSYALDK